MVNISKLENEKSSLLKYLIYIFFFSIFLNEEMFFIQIGSYSIRPFMVILMLILLLIINKEIRINKIGLYIISIFYAIFILITLPAVFYSPYFNLNASPFFRGAFLYFYQILTFFMTILILNNNSLQELKIIIRKVLFFNSLIAIILFLYQLATKEFIINQKYLGINYTYQGIPRMMGMFNDPNYFALYLTVFLWLYLFLLEKQDKLDYKTLMLSIISIFLTQSRAAIIANFVGLLLVLVFNNSKNKRKINFIIFYVALFLLTLLFLIPNDLIMNSLSRYNFTEDASFKERYNLLVIGIENIYRYPFGVGIGYLAEYYKSFFGTLKVAHNDFISIFIEGGIISLTLYCFIFLLAFLKSNTLGKIIVVIVIIILNTLTVYYFDPIIPIFLAVLLSVPRYRKLTL
jgi:hypothetical protein